VIRGGDSSTSSVSGIAMGPEEQFYFTLLSFKEEQTISACSIVDVIYDTKISEVKIMLHE